MKDNRGILILKVAAEALVLSLPVFIISRLGFYFDGLINKSFLALLLIIMAIASVLIIKKVIITSELKDSWRYIYAFIWAPVFFVMQKIWNLFLGNILKSSSTYSFTSMFTVVYIFAYSIIVLFFIIKNN